MHKPFKPLSINRDRVQPPSQDVASHPRKKRRISEADDDEVAATKAAISVAACIPPKKPLSQPHRRPLLAVNRNILEVNARQDVEAAAAQPEGYYTVLWRKYSTKKNVTWDGDGVLVVKGGYAELTDVSGRSMGRTACKEPLLPESEISVGSKVVQVESVLSKNEFLSGRCFLGTAAQPTPVESTPSAANLDTTKHGHTERVKLSVKEQVRQDRLDQLQSAKVGRAATLTSATKAKFKAPTLTSGLRRSNEILRDEAKPNWKHDPHAENALVMKRPNHVPNGRRIMEVVVDPILTKHLREHQRAGVSFLYECVMGMRDHQGEGAILADEMGLGKTLQTIALLWTLLRQSPIEGQDHVVRKALVVCPVSLINNWRKEFWKWLGKERIGIFVLDDNKFGKITDFTKGKSYRVMIVGYEKLRTIKDELAQADIDIVVCDEGHRLKTEKNQSARAIKELSTERRIVLTGTPMQNNFSEYHTMVDFVNPGLFGKYSVFKKQFEDPINRSRQPNAHSKDVEKGEARSEELANLTKQFILRRTADTLAEYLPPKTEYILFIRPTEAQANVYRAAVGASNVGSVITSPQASLQLIQMLTKICNSPRLVTAKSSDEFDGFADEKVNNIARSLSARAAAMPNDSAKLLVLDRLLQQIRADHPDEKVVIVSNFTSALDLIAGRLGQYGTLRLDGKTPPKDRAGLVEKFNRSSASNYFAFLLSAKAGGVGLNLIGANRLILFDCDWNPATDLQAMARIHRDGQKRPCYIYRFLVMGAMDEKVFQRQVSKRSLSDSVVDSKANSLSFTQDELRDLFTFDESGRCMTHELLGCSCGGQGIAEVEGPEVEDTSHEGTTDCNEAASDSEVQEVGAFVKASSYDADDIERRVRTGETGKRSRARSARAAKVKGLMEYQHIDPVEFVGAASEEDDFKAANAIDSVLSDGALARCLYDGGAGTRIAYIFAKTAS